jgi:hypothetical protein
LALLLFADVRHCSLALVSNLVSGNLGFTKRNTLIRCLSECVAS